MLKLFNVICAITTISNIMGNRTNNLDKSTTVSPITDILSKFHQNDYKLSYERCEYARGNTSFGIYKVHTFKYNRTTPLVNATFFTTVELGNETEVIAQLYKFASNEYRLFPLRLEFNLCEAIAKAVMGLDKFTKCGNVICPLLKNKRYYYCNWAPDETSFPPLIPTGQYMLELQFLYHSQELFVTNNYGTIYRREVLKF